MAGWTNEQITTVTDLMEIAGNDTGAAMFSYMVKHYTPEYKIILEKGSDTIGRKMRHIKTKKDEKARILTAEANYFAAGGEPEPENPETGQIELEAENPETGQIELEAENQTSNEQQDLGVAGKASSNNGADLGVVSKKRNGAEAINAVKRDLINCVTNNFRGIGEQNEIAGETMEILTSEVIKMISSFKFD